MNAGRDLEPDRDPIDLIRALGGLRPHEAANMQPAIAALSSHPDEDVRGEAVRLLTVRLKLVEYRPLVVRLISDEQEEDSVRQEAAYGLAALSNEATRVDDIRLLKDIVEDTGQSMSVRGAAYDALLIVARHPAFPTKSRAFDAERDVDWTWLAGI